MMQHHKTESAIGAQRRVETTVRRFEAIGPVGEPGGILLHT
jgi:hypothetical protein